MKNTIMVTTMITMFQMGFVPLVEADGKDPAEAAGPEPPIISETLVEAEVSVKKIKEPTREIEPEPISAGRLLHTVDVRNTEEVMRLLRDLLSKDAEILLDLQDLKGILKLIQKNLEKDKCSKETLNLGFFDLDRVM